MTSVVRRSDFVSIQYNILKYSPPAFWVLCGPCNKAIEKGWVSKLFIGWGDDMSIDVVGGILLRVCSNPC